MRLVAGFLLIFAAFLKGSQLLTADTPASPSIVAFQTVLELVLGVVVLSGHWWSTLRWVTGVLFSGFACYSLYLGFAGAASCNCFGPIHVSPWWSLLLDVAVVFGLLTSHFEFWGRLLGVFARRPQVTCMAILGGVLVAATVARFFEFQMAEARNIGMANAIAVLKPEQWVGKPLPIADSIDLDLSKGEWTLLLHRHDCPDCQKAVPIYEDLAANRNIAFVEVPPFGPLVRHRGLSGRLKDDRDWFVQTPMEIQIKDGVVINATREISGI